MDKRQQLARVNAHNEQWLAERMDYLGTCYENEPNVKQMHDYMLAVVALHQEWEVS